MRLAKFHDLNIIRTIFRFLFIIPIIMLSVDGMTPHTHELNMVVVSTVSGIGCIIQSAITLVIFFPRNLEHETQRWLDQTSDSQQQSRKRLFSSYIKSRSQTQRSHSQQRAKFALTDSPEQSKAELPMPDNNNNNNRGREARTYAVPLYSTAPSPVPDTYPPHPYAYSPGYSQKQGTGGTAHVPQYSPRDYPQSTGVVQSALTEANMRIFEGTVGRVNPMALYFTSPIDIQDESPVHHRRRQYVAYP
ncbi:hypothetical protein Clacol_002469 [Clathrus columnatus]|uniref:Uncharacterized protein n=1 Tax=Clathrus columnatus TaxID=1419009 RepID=A0AAV5A698_9AGAM|nr:hypothetical protein Clacol_002469 [Clathrus columnatus]